MAGKSGTMKSTGKTASPGLIRQANQLAAVADSAVELGFIVRLLTLCCLPRTDPGQRLQYKRVNGPFKLIMIAGGDNRLPYGNLPRLLLAWLCTEAVRTKSRDITLGTSLSQFMRKLGINTGGGGQRGNRTRLQEQMRRLFRCQIELIQDNEMADRSIASRIAEITEFCPNNGHSDGSGMWNSSIRLGEAFYEEVINHPVPLDLSLLRVLKRSSLGLDLYMWINYRTYTLRHPLKLSWRQLYQQFGSTPEQADDRITVQAFRQRFLRELRKIHIGWPQLKFAVPHGYLQLWPRERSKEGFFPHQAFALGGLERASVPETQEQTPADPGHPPLAEPVDARRRRVNPTRRPAPSQPFLEGFS